MEWISACEKPHGKPRHVAKDFDSFCHALLPLLRRKKRNNQCGIARIEFRVIKSNCTVKCVNYHLALGLALRFAAGAAFGAARLGLPGFARLLCENRPAIFQNCLGGFELVIATGVSIKAFRQAGTFSPIRGADELGGTSMQSTLSGHIAVYSQWLLSKRKIINAFHSAH